MKKYTSEQLAAYAKAFALQKFNTPEKIYEVFKNELNRRMKRAQPTVPLPEELERQSRMLAGKAHEMLGFFKEEAIEFKLSPGLKQGAWHPGVDLNSYQNYFNEFADQMAKGAITEAYKPIGKAVQEWKKKNRKR